MDLGKLIGEAEKLVDEAGGTSALEKDAMELKDVATGSGSLIDKGKQAATIVEAQVSAAQAHVAATPPAQAPKTGA